MKQDVVRGRRYGPDVLTLREFAEAVDLCLPSARHLLRVAEFPILRLYGRVILVPAKAVYQYRYLDVSFDDISEYNVTVQRP